MYFKSRADAGRQLAEQMRSLGKENITIIALSPGSVIVGAQIAMTLHANLMLLLMEEVSLPGENSPIAVVRQDGGFTYDRKLSSGEIDAYVGEFRGYLEEQKLEKFHKLNRLMSRDGTLSTRMLQNRVIILVSDGLNNELSLDAAEDFLKPIKAKRIVIATPIANVPVVDRMHVMADQIVCLDVLENYMFTDHYYEDNTIPAVENLLHMTDYLMLSWRQP